ncbi:transcription factor E [Methanobrevibacter sp. 87.7]|uniref:transcription factor E n=1 Tax=Methanobrevibacter sp. 87.7 TaxID=387957 RepID=UPI000B5029AB|nr:transcription factor E [Methanobrevibacter sp. 87.7]OWT33118.1 transcription factor E [Methanobrevibacter sp. 87.7]
MLDNPLVEMLIRSIIDNPNEKPKKGDEDKDNFKIVQYLNDGVTTDEEIAEKTGIKLNTVRKILYKLYDAGLASYKRSKDPETQWFTYDWKFEPEEVNKKVEESLKDIIKELKEITDNEENNLFFKCPDYHTRFDFADACEMGFTCPECGEELIEDDNSEMIAQLKEDTEKYEEILKDFEKSQ